MSLHTIIGLKQLAVAKQRLAPAVSGSRRRELMLQMLQVVTSSALEAALGPVLLASSEPSVATIARRLGVQTASDGGLPWNEGLWQAVTSLRPRPHAVLYLAGDLPLLRAADLLALAAAAPARGVCVARARDGGSNALLVRPALLMRPGFGVPGSAAVHAGSAAALGVPCVVFDADGLALDVDTVEDARDAGLLADGAST